MSAQLDTQPLYPWCVALEACRLVAGVPGFQQIIQLVQHEGRIPGSHQGCRVWGLKPQLAMMPAPTACLIARVVSAWAGREGRGFDGLLKRGGMSGLSRSSLLK